MHNLKLQATSLKKPGNFPGNTAPYRQRSTHRWVHNRRTTQQGETFMKHIDSTDPFDEVVDFSIKMKLDGILDGNGTSHVG